MKPNDENDSFMPNNVILGGIIGSLQYASRHLKAANDLYLKGYYQQSIPLGILSYEETSKAQYLLNSLQNKQEITQKEWKKITSHSFKLTHIEKSNLENVKNKSKFEQKIDQKNIETYLGTDFTLSQNKEIDVRNFTIQLLEKFQNLKKYCLYLDWDNTKKHFTHYNAINLNDRQSLNYFILISAEDIYFRLLYLLDLYENPLNSEPSFENTSFDSEKNILYVGQNLKELEKRSSYKNLKKLGKKYNKNKKNKQLISRGIFVLYALF